MVTDPEKPDRAGWAHVARSKNFVCVRCGEFPEYDEREQYFETKMCGWCAHQTQKEADA